jgi:nicotinamide-nucleotide amidase
VRIELINTGTELLLGSTLNTHQQWIGRQLADRGYTLARQLTIPDSAREIEDAAREALARADGVITTGGLGPTSDDVTRERIAAMLGLELRQHAPTRARLEAFYQARRRTMPQRTYSQTMVPEGATVLTNEHGTAPGLLLEIPAGRFRASASWLAMLPGPPRELRPMFTQQLLPRILQLSPLPHPFVCGILRTTGLPESRVEELVEPAMARFAAQGLEIGYCARPGEVDIRLSARGTGAAEVLRHALDVARVQVTRHVFEEGDRELEEVVISLLRERQRTLAVAESCTGGHLADRLTNVPGASDVFLGGWVTYSNAAKQQCLGVSPDTLEAHGAVSEPVAREMAEGARHRSGADYAIAITGIAGPSGGTPEKPVGTAFIALAMEAKTVLLNPRNPWDRVTFKQATSQQALELLRNSLLRRSG